MFIKQADSINKSLKLFQDDMNTFSGVKFISEPGRYFATKTHTLYVPIIAKRKTNNKIFYIIDESIYSSFSNITYDMGKPKFELVNKPKNNKLYDSVIFGRTCDSADKILESSLPELEIGDYFEIKNMGAYTTASSTNFNGFATTEKIYLC
jgi:ornithine decarboxylase